MNSFLQHHLTAAELDSLHEGAEVGRVASHLETCDDCRRMVELDIQLLAQLSQLSHFDPSPDFAPNIMARIERPEHATQPVIGTDTERAKAARRRVWIGGSLVGGLVTAGFAWAFANPGEAIGFATPAVQDVGNTLWMSLQGITANALEQPWFGAVRDTLATPSRALPALVGVAGAYTVALLGLRRLLTRPATDAGW